MGRTDGITANQILANASRLLLAAASWLLVHYVSKIENSIDSHTKSIVDLQIAQARFSDADNTIREDIRRIYDLCKR